jgi:hypothetical protein
MKYTVGVKCEATVYLLIDVYADDERAAEERAMKAIKDSEVHHIRKSITRIDWDGNMTAWLSPTVVHDTEAKPLAMPAP